ncbi:MAG: hypothetical protein ICV84_14300, partial [Flavisolibacter sp.]|nr:hypothetical protein [Flavisolibacter sp.]
MTPYKIVFLIVCLLLGASSFSQKAPPTAALQNAHYTLSWNAANMQSFTYSLKKGKAQWTVNLPSFEIDGKKVTAVLNGLKPASPPATLKNGVTEYNYEGAFAGEKNLRLGITFQTAPENPVLRFHYTLKSAQPLKLTKRNEKDNITYLSFTAATPQVKEVRLSEFNERFHATNKTEYVLDERYFTNNSSFMGPIAVTTQGTNTFLVAYEHGSQFPNRFLEFRLNNNRNISLQSVKGNYLDHQAADGFQSVWFQVAGVGGDEDVLAEGYRTYILNYLTQNAESRKPYIFYNTWGRQERVQWTGQKYLSSMNLDQTLKEIDRAHA